MSTEPAAPLAPAASAPGAPTTDLAARPHDPTLPLVPCRMVGEDWFDTAPYRWTVQVELPVSAARLFEIFEDPASWSRWAAGIGRVDWTSAKPYRAGTTRTVTFWGGAKVYEDFFVYDPPHRMAFCFYATSELIWTAFAERYTVQALGDDRCRLTWQPAYEPAGGFARVHPFIKPLMSLTFKLYMWRLRRYCARNPG